MGEIKACKEICFKKKACKENSQRDLFIVFVDEL